MQFWNELEGQTIDGQYPLRRLVRSEGRRAWFETAVDGQGLPATISLTEAATDADEVMARLQAAQNLKHPNLVEITQVGHARVDDTVVVYALMEPIEQNLSDVLQAQPLSSQEGREVAEALVGALTAIHHIGMSHGHMEAASVLATEAAVKLRSDCLQGTTAGQADDVAGVGAILFQAFTQRKVTSPTDPQINRIPAPFAEIVRNSFARRWTLGQIANALKPAAPVVPVVAPARAPASPPPPPAEEKKIPYRAPAPAIPVVKTVPAVAYSDGAARKAPRGIIAAVVVVLLAICGWLFLRAHSPVPSAAPTATASPAPMAAPTSTPTTSAPTTPAPGSPSPTNAPSPKPSAAVSSAHRSSKTVSPAPVASQPPNGRPVWRVVVYTYKGEKKAADGVAKISSQHPDLQAAMFNPAGSDVYMVILGGGMDRSHAQALLEKAKSEGLPADTYIRNFTE